MLLKDVMGEKGAVCTESMPLQQVYEMMRQSDGGFATVVENHAHQKPIGIITEHDICLQIVGKNRNPKGMAAANVMNTEVIKARRDLSVSECAKLAQKSATAKILVVDENGILCGTVDKDDLTQPRHSRSISVGHPHYDEYKFSQVDRIF